MPHFAPTIKIFEQHFQKKFTKTQQINKNIQTKKIQQLTEGCCWFKLNNLGLALGMTLNFTTVCQKG